MDQYKVWAVKRLLTRISLIPTMLSNHIQEIRECYQQAMHCAEQAGVQTDPKVKRQFLELMRRWELLARSYEDS